ncbi:hypothetical protein E2C01_002698 [Portunus trituberculatus]|uniref:Uncharacterized protein n=1 Tax=Portunus trituberculatus TaxID=210409 RepID=A0A5B7CML4_PORTR|nr:hypothetical protein [Portunus trituberculatus]
MKANSKIYTIKPLHAKFHHGFKMCKSSQFKWLLTDEEALVNKGPQDSSWGTVLTSVTVTPCHLISIHLLPKPHHHSSLTS